MCIRDRYCLKGVRTQAGTLMIAPELKKRVRFQQVNLTKTIDPSVGDFDVIFLRNVMIYFDIDTKRQVIENLTPRLKSGGWFVVGHSESLNGFNGILESVRPTIYLSLIHI